jgi:hypothetical protein
MDNPLEQTVFSDLAHLEKTLTEDRTGDRARAMLSYFEDVARSSEGMLQKPMHEGERQLANQLLEGFRASQRIVRHVWETLHSVSLPI